VTDTLAIRHHRFVAEDEKDKVGFPTSLAAALALVVAALAAVGLTDEALLRAVRNNPWWIGAFLSAALLGAAFFLLVQFWQTLAPNKRTKPRARKQRTRKRRSAPNESTEQGRDTGQTAEESSAPERSAEERGDTAPGKVALPERMRWFGLFGLAVLVFSTVGAIFVGAYAVHTREPALVTLQAAPIAAAPSAATEAWETGTIEITITARASGMTTKNDLLVQVLGLYSDPGPQASSPPPSGSPTPSPTSALAIPSLEVEDICEANHVWGQSTVHSPLDPAKAKLLMWDRIGPKADGTIDATWRIQVPAGTYAYVCAWAPLGGVTKPNTSAAYLRLEDFSRYPQVSPTSEVSKTPQVSTTQEKGR
jgi:hypothetical protein